MERHDFDIRAPARTGVEQLEIATMRRAMEEDSKTVQWTNTLQEMLNQTQTSRRQAAAEVRDLKSELSVQAALIVQCRAETRLSRLVCRERI